MIPFDEKNYQNFMETEMPVWLRDTVESGKLITYDGMELQYYYCVRKPSRATVVAVHGFCEFFGKYHELLYDLWSEGFSFFFLEQRGYGLSERENDDPETVYVRTFREYVKDLHFFMEEVVRKKAPDQVQLLFAHSMGGAVGARYLEMYPEDFAAAVLSSPMLRLNYGDRNSRDAHFLAAVFGGGKALMKRMPGASGFSETPDFADSCCTSEARYLYQFRQRLDNPAYRTSAASRGWFRMAVGMTDLLMREVWRVRVPVLIFQAGEETLVDNAAQNEFAEKCAHAKVVPVAGAKHEIFNCTEPVLRYYYSRLLSFLKRQAHEAWRREAAEEEARQKQEALRSGETREVLADDWEPYASYCTTGEFADLSRGFVRHCGPTAITNLLLAFDRRYSGRGTRLVPAAVFLRAAEIGRHQGLYWNKEILKKFGGTSDFMSGVFIRAVFRAFGRRDVKIGRLHALSEKNLLRSLRAGKLVYLQMHRHPRYGNHHVVCTGAEMRPGVEKRRELYFVLADGWSPKPVYLRAKELGNGSYREIWR